MKVNQKIEVEREAKVLKIHAKCSDMCNAELFDQEGKSIHENDGYVPSFMPDRGGDYIVLDIDIDTGQILNWKVPTTDQLQEFINGDDV